MNRSPQAPHLFDDWTEVRDRLRRAPVIALFLDFDGTLAPLKPRPEQVSLDRTVRQALAVLARSARFRVWIISGRRQADICALVHIPGIRYLGLHGWEGRRGSRLASETHRWLSSLTAWFTTLLAPLPGVWIEDKVHALAIHYRDAKKGDARVAHGLVTRVIAPFAEQFRLEKGKRVWEILPRELGDKGVAVRDELSSVGPCAVPVYVGDDQVDESAFAALPGGVTVHVGRSGRSKANYRLSDVAQVGDFLHRLTRELA